MHGLTLFRCKTVNKLAKPLDKEEPVRGNSLEDDVQSFGFLRREAGCLCQWLFRADFLGTPSLGGVSLVRCRLQESIAIYHVLNDCRQATDLVPLPPLCRSTGGLRSRGRVFGPEARLLGRNATSWRRRKLGVLRPGQSLC